MLRAGTGIGPYEVLSLLGAGGMGEVYRARDTRLGREVAVKVLPARFASDPERLRRFEQEARAVAALSHPNILAIFDVGTHDGSPYLVAELLEGESLRDRLRKGSLSVSKAVEISVQIVQGLSAAHEKEIVHRDLKPGNVFVGTNGHVKILDFGLAKLANPEAMSDPYAETSSDEPSTRSGAVLGTMGYMSPEQLRGQPVDARSDIFSFGCVLYEALAGTPPFLRRTSAETASAILTEDPAPLSGTGRPVAPALQEIVSRCLEKRAEERFSSAHDLALALRAFSGGSATPSSVSAPGPRVRRPWLVGVAAVGLLAAAASLLVWAPWKRERPEVRYDPASVVVAAFENQTGDASLDKIGSQIADALTNDLSKTGELKVAVNPAAAGRREEASGDPLLRLAKATRSALVVAGTYDLRGEQLEVQARVVEPWDGTVVYTGTPVRCPRGDPLSALADLRQRVTGSVAWRSDLKLRRWWKGYHPPRYDALLEYRLAVAAGEDWDVAYSHLGTAAVLDPGFYLAQIARVDDAATPQLDEAAKQLAVLEANIGRLMPGERLYLRAVRAELDGHRSEGLAARREMAALSGYPDDPNFAIYIAAQEMMVNRPAEAIRDLSVAVRHEELLQRSVDYHPALLLVWAYHMNRDYEGALRAARESERRFPDVLQFNESEAAALAALARLDELESVVGKFDVPGGRPDQPKPAQLMITTAQELKAHGHREAGLRLAERAIAWWQAHPDEEDCQACLMDALWRCERWAEAKAIADTLAVEKPDDINFLGVAGILAVRVGDVAEARRIDARLAALKQPYQYGGQTYMRAGIAAALGDKDRAVMLLQDAFAEGRRFWVGVHYAAVLEPLWGYQPFEELIRPKG